MNVSHNLSVHIIPSTKKEHL